ncbi:hypothetical protein C0J52_14532 [Blattella germanica]|nr:hypothetical protein C0J52_14532 [Blattella germanica]
MKLPGMPNKDGGASTELEAPDGGWGWMVVIGTAALFMVTLTPDSCFGLIFGDFLVEVGAGTAFVTTGVSVCIGSAAALGLVMNYALNTFSCRQVGVTGAIIYFCGSFLTAFVTNVYQIIFTYGILQGIGLGLMVPATFTSFNHYFVRRRTFAMAIAQLIIGVAAMVIPLVIQLLLEEYGFRGTQAIIAAFTLHALLGMVVQQPVRYHMKRKKKVERSGSAKVDTADELIGLHSKASELNIQIENVNIGLKIHKHETELATIRRTSQEKINIQFQKVDSKDARISVGVVNEVEDSEASANEKEVVVSSEVNTPDEHKFLVHSGHSKKYVTAEIGITVKGNGSTSSVNKIRKFSDAESQDGCDRCWSAVVDFLDLKLLLDPVYVNISIGVSISLICMLQFFAFYPILVLDLGYSKSDTAIFIAVCNALDLMGRVVIALIGIFSPGFSSRALFLTGTLITVAGRLLLILFNDFLAMALMTGCLGFARSFLQVPLPLIFAEYNLERFPSAFGLYSVMFGLIALMVGPFTGLVRDLTDSYAMCINTLNGLTFFGCILPWIAEHAVAHVRTKSE